MGVDLLLKYKDEIVANLGRAYKFKDHPQHVWDEEVNHFASRLAALCVYTPKNLDEVEDIVCKIEEYLDSFAELFVDIGKSFMLNDILENENFSVEKN